MLSYLICTSALPLFHAASRCTEPRVVGLYVGGLLTPLHFTSQILNLSSPIHQNTLHAATDCSLTCHNYMQTQHFR